MAARSENDPPRKPAGKRARSAAPAVEDEQSIGFWLRHAHRAFVRALAQELAPYDILPAQWTVLRALWRRDGITQVALAERIGVEKASLTGVLASLEKAGLVRRVRDPRDRRKLDVRLTPAGRRLKRRLLACGETVNRRAARGVAAADLAGFTKLLRTLAANLEAGL